MEHVATMPKTRQVYVYDFTDEWGQDKRFKKKNIHIWQVKRGTQEEIEDFIGHCYSKGNCTVILSESDNYLSFNSPVLLAFVTTARNRGINFMIDCKRAKAVKPNYRTRFDKLILFQTTLSDDIDYICDWTGQGKGSFEMLRDLGQGDYIEVDLNANTISEVKRL